MSTSHAGTRKNSSTFITTAWTRNGGWAVVLFCSLNCKASPEQRGTQRHSPACGPFLRSKCGGRINLLTRAALSSSANSVRSYKHSDRKISAIKRSMNGVSFYKTTEPLFVDRSRPTRPVVAHGYHEITKYQQIYCYLFWLRSLLLSLLLSLTIITPWLPCLRTWPGSTWTRRPWCGTGTRCQDRTLWGNSSSRCRRASSRFKHWTVSRFTVSGPVSNSQPVQGAIGAPQTLLKKKCGHVKQSFTCHVKSN